MDPLLLIDALPEGDLRDTLIGMGLKDVNQLSGAHDSLHRAMSSGTG